MARTVVTKDDYFVVALDMLAADGHTALRIGALCQRLGVTTGSFYHYFGGFDGFVAELLTSWSQEKRRRFLELTLAVYEPVGRMHALKQFALGLPHGAEAAIRSWAHVNPAVAGVQRSVDDERLDAVRRVVHSLVIDPAEADSLATTAMSILIGHQQWRSPIDIDALSRALDLLEGLVLQRAELTPR